MQEQKKCFVFIKSGFDDTQGANLGVILVERILQLKKAYARLFPA
jgi:hypothetical protein